MPSPPWCCLYFEPCSLTFQKIRGAIPKIFQINWFLILKNQSLIYHTYKTRLTKSKSLMWRNVFSKVYISYEILKIKFGRLTEALEEQLELYSTLWPTQERSISWEALREVSPSSQEQPQASLFPFPANSFPQRLLNKWPFRASANTLMPHFHLSRRAVDVLWKYFWCIIRQVGVWKTLSRIWFLLKVTPENWLERKRPTHFPFMVELFPYPLKTRLPAAVIKTSNNIKIN